MVINIPEIKRKVVHWFWILLPILLGLIMNFIYQSMNYRQKFTSRDLEMHLSLFGLSVVFIIGGVSSYLIFKNKKRIQNYLFSIIAIIYTQIIIFNNAIFNGEENRLTTIIYGILIVYGLYLTFNGVVHLKNHTSKSFRGWLRKKNIHIISSRNEKNLKEKYPDLDLAKPVNFEERFSVFNNEINNINDLLAKHSNNLISELKLFEHDALTFKKKLAEDNSNLVTVKGEIEKLNKLKDISEEQIDILLEKQNKGQTTSIIIGFVLGIVGSIIATFVYETFMK